MKEEADKISLFSLLNKITPVILQRMYLYILAADFIIKSSEDMGLFQIQFTGG